MKNKILLLTLTLFTLASLASPVLDALKRRTNRAIAIAAKDDKSRATTWQSYSNQVAAATNAAQVKAVWTNIPPYAWSQSRGTNEPF